MSKLTFDAKKVAPQAAFDTIPKGWYSVAITASDTQPTKKSKDGMMLNIELTVLAGEFAGRKVFDRINIKNASAKAQEIGQQQLSAICHAVGVFQVTDSVELHNKPFEAKIGLEDARTDEVTGTEYEARNTYKGCRVGEGGAVVASTTSGTPGWVKPAAATESVSSSAPAEAKPAPGKKPAAPGKPAAPVKEPAPAAEVTPDTREFYVYVGDESHEKTGDEVREMLADGMPSGTPICLQSESDKGWKTVADFGLDKPNTPAEPAAAPAAPAKKIAPWLKKK